VAGENKVKKSEGSIVPVNAGPSTKRSNRDDEEKEVGNCMRIGSLKYLKNLF